MSFDQYDDESYAKGYSVGREKGYHEGLDDGSRGPWRLLRSIWREGARPGALWAEYHTVMQAYVVVRISARERGL